MRAPASARHQQCQALAHPTHPPAAGGRSARTSQSQRLAARAACHWVGRASGLSRPVPRCATDWPCRCSRRPCGRSSACLRASGSRWVSSNAQWRCGRSMPCGACEHETPAMARALSYRCKSVTLYRIRYRSGGFGGFSCSGSACPAASGAPRRAAHDGRPHHRAHFTARHGTAQTGWGSNGRRRMRRAEGWRSA